MPNHTPTFLDEFELKGEWWFPATPQTKVVGILSYKPGHTIYLETIGSLDGTDSLSDSKRSYPALILGVANDGEEITLFENAEVSKRGSTRGGSGSIRYQTFYVFRGVHLNAIPEMEFDNCYVNYSNLEEWAGRRPFESEPKLNGKKLEVWNISFSPSESFNCEVPSIESNVSLSHGYGTGRFADFYRTLMWEHAAHIVIKPKDKQDFRWFQRNYYKLKELYVLLMGTPVSFGSISFEKQISKPESTEANQKQSSRNLVHLYFNQGLVDTDKSLHPSDMLVRNLDLDDQERKNMFDAWLEPSERFDSVRQLYFGTVGNTKMYDHLRFLSLTQALETYHRLKFAGQYIAESDYKKIGSILVSAIPNGTPEDLRSSLKSRIKYGNEHSLRKRMKSIIDGLSEECRKLVSDNPAQFVGQVVDTRNYLTHYTDELKKDALKGSELYNASIRLKILLIVLFLLELGLDQGKIVKLIRQNEKLMFGWVSDITFDSDDV